ncbi:MAG: hypothetical protein JWN67_2785 [Actinomycetia bacterium]|nr:hypothetical protein [Actinomycetes bacterium]
MVTVAVEPWGPPAIFLVLTTVLVAVAAGFGALTAGFVATLAVAFVVAMAMAVAVRWKQRESMAALRAKRRSGELYEELRRSRRSSG